MFVGRFKREVENFKEENRTLKHNSTLLTRETEELKNEAREQERRIEQLAKLEDECHRLQEEQAAMLKDSQALQEQFETVVMEKEDLEYQTQEAMQALSDERESRSLLEMKLSEDRRLSPINVHWGEGQRQAREEMGQLSSVSAEERDVQLTPSPPPRSEENFAEKFHSTPYTAGGVRNPPPSLLSEIHDSFMGEGDKEELERLQGKLAEMEEMVCSVKNERKVLEENLMACSARESKQVKELESLKEKFAKEVCEKEQKVEELNQRVLIRDEQIEQLRSKLSKTTAEKTSMEIEVDGLDNEIQRIKAVSGLEIDKYQRESAQEQNKNVKLVSQIGVLEEQAAEYGKTIQTLENVMFNSHTELATMTEDIRSLQKVVGTLTVDVRPSPTATTKASVENGMPDTPNGDGNNGILPALTNGGTGGDEERYYSLKIGKRKASVQVHEESNSLRAITNLREQLKLVRSPLEQFTKTMLERSLMHSAKHAPPSSSSSPDPTGTNRKNTLDLEATISKWKSKFMHKTEELNNLRSIMKARATTAEVATSSLRSKLEGQARTYQTELTKLKYQIKILKKEKDEHLSLRTMYAKRCDDYIDEITRVKKETESLQQEYDSLYVCLEKTIKRKLELSTELEEYKMEQERQVLIPKRLESSRV